MSAVENIKEVAELVKKFNDIELNRRILKLEEEVIDLTRDKRRADDKIDELERALKFSKELSLRDNLYWVEGDNVGFCTACWDAKRLPVHVKRLPLPIANCRFQCPHCENLFSVRNSGI
jgi:hypothetical protein